ncbi:MAG: hypothetical protein ABIP94_19595 [Planctomycetota bacterium]
MKLRARNVRGPSAEVAAFGHTPFAGFLSFRGLQNPLLVEASMGTPHDIWFHFTHRHPRHAAAWLRSCLPPALVALLD